MSLWFAASGYEIQTCIVTRYHCGTNLEATLCVCFCFSQFLGRSRTRFPQGDRRIGNGSATTKHLPAQKLGTEYRTCKQHGGEQQHSNSAGPNPTESVHFFLRREPGTNVGLHLRN